MPQCVCDLPGYNSWPMISRAGNRLICLYSRGSEHTIDEPSRGIYARYSDDEGIHWSCEVMVNNDSEAGEVPIGKGMDPEDGSVLFFVRRCTKGLASLLHDLYRTTDGIHFQRIATLDLDEPPMQITDILILEEDSLIERLDRRQRDELVRQAVLSMTQPDREIFLRFYYYCQNIIYTA